MGARGPAPTPTRILEARGSWLAKGREGEPRPPVKAPSCPAWLPKEAKAEWRRQVKQLQAMGLVAEIDRPLLAAYCEAWAEFVGACAAVEERLRQDKVQGYALAVKDGLVNVKNKAVERLTRIAQQFGFSPSARARLRTPDREERQDSGKGRFFAASAN